MRKMDTGWFNMDKNSDNQAILSLYLKTIFYLPDDMRRFPARFAVITAFNPMGKSLTSLKNKTRNMQLHPYAQPQYRQTINACAPDLSHCEESYIIELPLPDCQQLGKKLGQLAFFWIEHDKLSIIPAHMQPETPIDAGSFKKKVIYKP